MATPLAWFYVTKRGEQPLIRAQTQSATLRNHSLFKAIIRCPVNLFDPGNPLMLQPVMRLPLGMGSVTPIGAEALCDLLTEWIEQRRGAVVGNLNLHALYVQEVNEDFRRFCDSADLLIVDGWPVLALARLVSRQQLSGHMRVGSSDWLSVLLQRNPAICIVAVGGTEQSARGAALKVASLTTVTTWHGFDGFSFRSVTGSASISDALGQADLVLVGLGMPRQERWIEDNRHLMSEAAVIANVGGCLDYLSGEQSLAPRWLGPVGLEWLYRLAASPRRLAWRYLIEPWLLGALVARRMLKTKARRW